MNDVKKQNIMLVIRKREKVLFDGEIKSFTSSNTRGAFDVLYEHANFISIINKNCVIRKLDGSVTEIKIDEGIVRVHENKVTVYLGIMG
jgi:F0F1-type ATP synthase epsilon subunit